MAFDSIVAADVSFQQGYIACRLPWPAGVRVQNDTQSMLSRPLSTCFSPSPHCCLCRKLKCHGQGPSAASSQLQPAACDLGRPSPACTCRYLNRIEAAVNGLKRETDGAPVTLLAHSAGGWLGRLYLLGFGTAGIDRLVSIGSPHQPPPQVGMQSKALQVVWAPVRRLAPSAWDWLALLCLVGGATAELTA